MEENTRLSDLTRMLLSSPSFSGFLDTLAANPATSQTTQTVQRPQTQIQQPQQQIRKDINPYAAQQQMQQQQHVGMTMIPEHAMDLSMLDLNTDGGYSYQPQVFSVLSLPETTIDTDVLSGKSSAPYTPMASEDEGKTELPYVSRVPASEVVIPTTTEEDEELDQDPMFALFHTSPTSHTAPELKKYDFDINILANISIKPAAYELVTKIDDSVSDAAVKRMDRLEADMDACVERLMGMGL